MKLVKLKKWNKQALISMQRLQLKRKLTLNKIIIIRNKKFKYYKIKEMNVL